MEERELIDYINVIWKKKWIIIIGTVLCMAVAGFASVLLKPVYEIDTIIQLGKIFVEDKGGNFNQIIVESPQQIAEQIKYKSYNALIASELKMDEKKLPKIKAERIGTSNLIRIWIRSSNIEFSKKILNLLISYVKKDVDGKIDVEINNIDSLVKSRDIEKKRRIKEIEILKNKLRIVEQRKKDIMKEMHSIKNKINELEKEQLKVLKKENRSDVESLSLLLYSNEIQQSLRYYDILNEKLSRRRIEEEDIKSNMENQSAIISALNSEIANLGEKKGRLDHTKVIKGPTPSIYPKYPKKKSNIIIACILGIFIFSFITFFIDYIEKSKS